MQLHRQPVRARGREHAPRLRRREADRLAERVDRIGEPGARRRGNRLAADEIDVVVGAPGEFRRHRVRREQRRPHVDADLGRDAPRRGELPALARGVEPVAGLDLDRRHALARQRREPRPARRDELVVARRARRATVALIPPPACAMSA